MAPVFPRRTLRAAVSLEGIGLHSGMPCKVRIVPRDGEGVFFSFGSSVWSMADGEPEGSGRGTVLAFPDGNRVMTVEHVLGALGGLGLDGLEIRVDGGEMPSLDGSAAPLVKALADAGIRDDGEFCPIELSEPVFCSDRQGLKSIAALPWDRFTVTYAIDYPGTAIGRQCLSLDVADEGFAVETAPCRTFALMEEISPMRERGLAMGGSLENALIVDGMKVMAKGGLRFSDEFVRHKILDLTGDLFLLGRPLAAHVVAFRAGHVMHHELRKKISDIFSMGGRSRV